MKGLVDELLKEIVERYMKMGAGQFLRDFRRDYHLKKSLAHYKAMEKNFSCTFVVFDKRVNTQRLNSLVHQMQLTTIM